MPLAQSKKRAGARAEHAAVQERGTTDDVSAIPVLIIPLLLRVNISSYAPRASLLPRADFSLRFLQVGFQLRQSRLRAIFWMLDSFNGIPRSNNICASRNSAVRERAS